MIGVQLRNGNKPDLYCVKTTRKRLAKVQNEFTLLDFCTANNITKDTAQKTIKSARKYRFIETLPREDQFKPATYRKVKK